MNKSIAKDNLFYTDSINMTTREPINFEYKKVETPNFERFSEMYRLCFNSQVDEKYFLWKYRENPAGEEVAFEALHEGKVAGFYGVIPEFYTINGVKTTIHQSMDTMTHPDYQKRGLFTKLARMTYDYIFETEKRINLIGIAGITSFYGFVNKLDWQNILKINYLFSYRGLFKAKNLLKRKEWLQCRRINRFDASFNEFFSKKEKRAKIYKLYNDEILNWKICSNPVKKFDCLEISGDEEIIGYCIYRVEESGRCQIYYLDFLHPDIEEKYLSSFLAELYEKTKSHSIFTWQPVDQRKNANFIRCGFLVNPYSKGPYSYKPPLIVYSRERFINQVNWFDPANYEIQPILQD